MVDLAIAPEFGDQLRLVPTTLVEWGPINHHHVSFGGQALSGESIYMCSKILHVQNSVDPNTQHLTFLRSSLLLLLLLQKLLCPCVGRFFCFNWSPLCDPH